MAAAAAAIAAALLVGGAGAQSVTKLYDDVSGLLRNAGHVKEWPVGMNIPDGMTFAAKSDPEKAGEDSWEEALMEDEETKKKKKETGTLYDDWWTYPHGWTTCADRAVVENADRITLQGLRCSGTYSDGPTGEGGDGEKGDGTTLASFAWKAGKFPCNTAPEVWIEGSLVNKAGKPKRGRPGKPAPKPSKTTLWCPEATVYEVRGRNATAAGVPNGAAAGAVAALSRPLRARKAGAAHVDLHLATKTFLGEQFHGKVGPAVEELHLQYFKNDMGHDFYRAAEHLFWARTVVDAVSRDVDPGGEPVRVADFGCGFGWLGLAVLAAVENTHVYVAETQKPTEKKPDWDDLRGDGPPDEVPFLAQLDLNGFEGRATYMPREHVRKGTDEGTVLKAVDAEEGRIGRELKFHHTFFYPTPPPEKQERAFASHYDGKKTAQAESDEQRAERERKEKEASKERKHHQLLRLYSDFVKKVKPYVQPGGTVWLGCAPELVDDLFYEFGTNLAEARRSPLKGVLIRRYDVKNLVSGCARAGGGGCGCGCGRVGQGGHADDHHAHNSTGRPTPRTASATRRRQKRKARTGSRPRTTAASWSRSRTPSPSDGRTRRGKARRVWDARSSRVGEIGACRRGTSGAERAGMMGPSNGSRGAGSK